MVLAVGPWTVRNYVALHAFIPMTTKAGSVLWEASYGCGESVLYSGGLPPYVETYLREHPNEAEQLRFFMKEALTSMKSDPIRYLRLGGVKFVRLWFGLGYPVPAFPSQYVQALAHLILLVLAGLSIPVISNRTALSFVLLILAVFTLAHMATMSNVRFSIPLMPLVFLLAVRGFARLVPQLQVECRR